MPKHETINIEVDYTDEELRQLGERVARLYRKKTELETQKKNAADEFKEEITSCEVEIKELCGNINRRFRAESVTCRVEIDEAKQEKVFYHPKTNKEVRREAYRKTEDESLFAKTSDSGDSNDNELDEDEEMQSDKIHPSWN